MANGAIVVREAWVGSGRVGSGRVGSGWVSSLGKFIEYINDGTNILNNKILWLVSNHETGL